MWIFNFLSLLLLSVLCKEGGKILSPGYLDGKMGFFIVAKVLTSICAFSRFHIFFLRKLIYYDKFSE